MNKNMMMVITACALAGGVANAQQVVVPVGSEDDVNIAGIAVGAVPDYMGSSHDTFAAGPVVRYTLPNSERYFLLLGGQATFNVLNDENWRFGPMLNYRWGRNSDVEDSVVKRMDEIDGTVEGGAFIGYRLKLGKMPLHQINFGADLAGSANGVIGDVNAIYWRPLTRTTILTVGLGTTIVNGKWMNTYFGVTSAHDIALFPSLGGKPYNASGGFKGVHIPFGVSQALSKHWMVSVGGRLELLVGDAKDSPVTSQRGNSTQVIYGAGVAYLF